MPLAEMQHASPGCHGMKENDCVSEGVARNILNDIIEAVCLERLCPLLVKTPVTKLL